MSEQDHPETGHAGKGQTSKGRGAKGPRKPRRWMAVAAGSTTALVAAAAVAAAMVVPGATATADVAPSPVVLPVGATVANCPGPTQLLSGDVTGTDPQFAPGSSGTTSQLAALVLSTGAGVLPGTVLSALGAGSSAVPLATLAAAPADGAAPPPPAAQRAAFLGSQAVAAPTVLSGQPVGGQRATTGGAVTVAAKDGDLRGLAAANCQQSANDLWISGASTTVGRTAVLNLVNSSQTAATVSLDLFGAKGPVQAPGARGLLVPAGKSRAVVLAGLAPDQASLSVHVKSSGGPVTATIQQSVLRGLTPGGVDFLQPGAAPSATAVVTGVRVADPAAAAKAYGQDDYAAPALTVTVPGASDAVVSVKVYGANGQQALANGGVLTAKAGSVTELPLTGLPAGTYALALESDSSITASVRVVNTAKPGEPMDFAVVPATNRIGDGGLVMLPKDTASTLTFGVAAGQAVVSLVPVTDTGVLQPARKVTVNGGTSVVVDPAKLAGDAAVGFVVSATGDPVYGTQLLGTNGTADVAALPFPGTDTGRQSVTMVLGY
ncbi:DUF5719 family protein [Specibacter cremeus]|uniref:DUF5719 family protein n=1 Tax=Specibacter cremeus TaxID=1629051 RepID=UPI000F786E69|nr:DUF5719 family protein [Specibacter cremeus]